MAVPNSFTNGTVADADEVNENFTYCTDAITALGAPFIERATALVGGLTPAITESNPGFQSQSLSNWSNAFDNSKTTYATFAISAGNILGSPTATFTFTMAQQYKTALISWDFTFNKSSNGSCGLYYSKDGTNWVTLDSSSTNGENKSGCLQVANLEYFRFTVSAGNQYQSASIYLNNLSIISDGIYYS